MKTKIVVINYGHRLNKGAAALLHTRVKTLKKLIPDAEFSVFSFNPEIANDLPEVIIYPALGQIGLSKKTLLTMRTWKAFFCLFRCGLWNIFNKFFRLDLRLLRKADSLNTYFDADVVISTGGDGLTDDYVTLSFLSYIINFMYALLLNKRVVIYAETIGPYSRWWNKAIAKHLLNRVSLITLREQISLNYLKQLKIKTAMYLTADSAFLLEPVSMEQTQQILAIEKITKKPLIGFSVSRLISNYGFPDIKNINDKYKEYIKIISQCADYLATHYDVTIVFIPHVIDTNGNDDRTTADDIFNLIRNQQSIVLIKNEYSPEELKAIIGQCDLFVGSRMHATIAATSMHVPTVAISYGIKTKGIIGDMLGYNQYILDIKNIDFCSLISAITNAWENREEIKRELNLKMVDIKKQALLNAELVKNLLKEQPYK